MNHSTTTKSFQSSIAIYWFDKEGILQIQIKNTPRSMENAQESFELIKRICNTQKVCVIIDTTKADFADKETRNYIISQFPIYFKAMAFISHSPVGQIISSLMCVEPSMSSMERRIRLPMEIFQEEGTAKEWIRQYV